MATWNPKANEILIKAVEIDDLDARQRYLDSACGGDTELRRAVDQLLSAHQQAGRFLLSEGSQRTDELSAEAKPADPLLQPGKILAGRFVVRQRLGEGGMGVVYLADQTRPVRRAVAIKLIKESLNIRRVALRFDQERNALALMEHPHIAKIFDAGVVDLETGDELDADAMVGGDLRRGIPFFAMEYIQGSPITEYCNRNRVSPPERLALFIPVCEAVQHAHQKGIIHRDLKPSNILVETIDERPIAKVIDFGVAKATGGQLTEESLHTAVGSIVGTLEYMSPEQAKFSHDIDTRTDVYALGVVLYELLAGSVPHSRQDLEHAGLEEMLRIIKEVDPLAPSSKLSSSGSLPNIASERALLPSRLVRLVRGDLDWIVLKALDKDRNRRYESVAGLAADIKRYLDEEPVLARPPSTAYRIQKAYRRHRPAFLAAGFALLLLLLGILGTSTGFVAASRSARLANQEATRATIAERQALSALDDIKQERDNAETQRQVADAVKTFLLKDLLEQADVKTQADRLRDLGSLETSGHELKRDPTVRELVDRAAEQLAPDKIESKFPGQPQIQAELLLTVGFVYNSVGEFRKAIEYLRRARAIFESEHGPHHPDTLVCMVHLARSFGGARHKDQFLELALELLDRHRTNSGETHEQTVNAIARVGNAYAAVDQLDKAISYAKQAVTLCEQNSERNDEWKTDLEFSLAGKYMMAGRLDDAASRTRRVYEERLETLGAEHPKTIISGAWLASIYVRRNQPEEAISLYDSILPRIQNLYGDNHPQTIATMDNLASAYRKAGDPQRAITIFEDTLTRRIARYGPDDADTLRIVANLGVNYFEIGRLAEAIEKLSHVLDAGRDEHSIQWAIEPLARALEQNGEPEKAEQVCRDHVDHLRQNFPDKSKPMQTSLLALAMNLNHQQKYSDAEPVLRELLVLNEKYGPDNWTTFNTKSLLGSALLAQDRLDEAEPLLSDGFAGMKQRQQRIPRAVKFHLHDAANWLVELHESRGNSEEVSRWRRELESLE